MMIGVRRYVNVVAENYKSAVCSLHRQNVSEHLFYPSTAEAEAAKPEVSRLGALPAPTYRFQSTPSLKRNNNLFALVSPRILWSSPTENTLLYDFGSDAANYVLPSLRYKGCHPITISIPRPDAPEEDLYVMSSIPYPNALEVLRFGSHSNSKVNQYPKPPETWQWSSLPPPPLPEGAFICSHALLHDGRTICVTAAPRGTAGTYFFDTVEREWSRAPDNWDLPFFGGAEYIPGSRLWLGITIDGNRLCLSDLSGSADEERSPTLTNQWEGVQTPEEWKAAQVKLINLGKGRFCIFKVIHDVADTDGFDDFSCWGNLNKMLALLSGVEISYSPEQGLSMVTHKTLSYIFNQDKIKWVL